MPLDHAPAYSSLPPWAQVVTAIIFVAGAGIVMVKGWFKPSGEHKIDPEDIAEALRHMKWIARHLERQADAAERANELMEQLIEAKTAKDTPIRAPPRTRRR